jgi:hypothetical protein
MLTKATKIISLQPNNAKHIKGFDMNINEMTEFKSVTTINSHFLLGSEKLFINPMNNFSNQFKYDHSIILMDSHDRHHMTEEQIKAKVKQYYRNLAIHWEIKYESRVFVGFGQDCLYLFDLYTNHGLVFDAAILINFDFSVFRNNEIVTKGIKNHTKIYNFYNYNKTFTDTDLAHVNQSIPTRLSPAFSKRFALETAGVLTYDTYGLLQIDETSPSEYKMIQDEFTLVS